MTKEQIDELAKDYAAEWYRRYEDMGVGMDQAWWILPLVAKSMVKAYKKGYYAAKQKYNKPSKRSTTSGMRCG